ncbi:hypothetical protein M3Y99_00546100 [Aphelenchoides fujianensis]|nr:hypothetical protein M3Y99_00546100 [Aphelenchoides fujianensis]
MRDSSVKAGLPIQFDLQPQKNLTAMDHVMEIQTAEQLEPKMRELERDVYPRLRELERWERSWTRVRNTHTADQEHKFRTSNYTFLSPDQLRLLYNSPRTQQEARLERDIRKLAKLNEEAIRKRAKRAYDGEFGPTVRPPRAQVPVFTPAGRVEERKDDRWVEISQDVEVDFGPPAHHRVHNGTIEISNKMTTVEPKKEEAEGCSPQRK